MILTVLDGNGVAQQLITTAQESPVDKSGTIAVTGTPQLALDANSLRSGWIMQNLGSNPIHVNDLGTAGVGAGSFSVAAGAFFPPEGYPVSTGAISVIGTANDSFTAREW